MARYFEYSGSKQPSTPTSSSSSTGLVTKSSYRFTGGGGTVSGNGSNTVDPNNVGKFNIDLTDLAGSVGENIASAAGLAGGLTGGLAGAIGQIGFGDGKNIGALADVPGTALEALGGVKIAPWNPEGYQNIGDLPGRLADLAALPERGIQRTIAGRRVEGAGDEPLPPDLAARLAAGEPVDRIADELVARGMGYSNNPIVNLAGQVVFDPLNLVDLGVGKGLKFAKGAEIALRAGEEVGVGARFAGTAYAAASRGLGAGAAATTDALLGPITTGVFHSLGTQNYFALRNPLRKLDSSYANAFEDALALGTAQLDRAVIANEFEREVRLGFRAVSDLTPEKAAEGLLKARTFRNDSIERAVENLLDSIAPDLRGVSDLRGWAAERLSLITGVPLVEALRVLPKTVNEDMARLVHLATYGKAGDELVDAAMRITPDELAAAKLGKDPEYLTILAPDTVTQERAADILADLEARGAAAAMDALRQYPDDLRKLQNLAGNPEGLVVKMREFLTQGKSAFPQELKTPTTGTHPLPSSLAEFRARWDALGYRVGFAPDDFVKVIVDADGEEILTKPFMMFASERAPLTWRNPMGRLMDGLFRGINQTKIITASRRRMVNYAAGNGMSRAEAEAFHRAIINKAVDSGTTPRGLSMLGGEPYADVLRQVFGDARANELMAQGLHPTWLVMKSFEGNLKQVGLTQKITGKAKVATAERGNMVAGIAEGIYPNFRFRFSPIFQFQELLESPFWNTLRGINPFKKADPEATRIFGELLEITPDLKYLEEAGYVTHLLGGKATKNLVGPRTLIGKALRTVPNVKGYKEAQRVKQIMGELGPAFKDAVEKVNPQIWRRMEEAYGTTDPSEIAQKYIMERRALAEGETAARRAAEDARPPDLGIPRTGRPADLTQQIEKAFPDFTPEQVHGFEALLDARARTWANQRGRHPDEWWAMRVNAIERGGEVGPFMQRERIILESQAEAKRLVPAPPVEESTRRLNLALNLDPAKAGPKAHVVDGVESLTRRVGGHTVGRVSKEEWLRMVEDTLDPEEFHAARAWYANLAAHFEVYGEDAPRMALAWLLSQVRASPAEGFTNVLRSLDKVGGKLRPHPDDPSRILIAGTQEGKLMTALSGGDLKLIGSKIHDFVDSFIGKLTRTVVNDDARGLQPAAFDVWAQRDAGFVDPTVQAWALEKHGIDLPLDLKSPGSVNDSQYEYGVRFYNEIADHLNSINYDGGGWTAFEAQAVGWTRVIKSMGGQAQFPDDIIGRNIRRVAFDLGAGAGSPWESLFPSFYELPDTQAQAILKDFTDWLIPQVEKLTGVRILGYDTGLGFWGSYPGTGSAVLNVLGSPEAAQDAMDVIGYATRQAMVMGSRPLPSGATAGLDILGEGLGDIRNAQKLWNKLNEIAPRLAHGAQPVTVKGKPGIRIMRDPSVGTWTKKNVEEFRKALDEAADQLGFRVDVREGRFDTSFSRSNDWLEAPDGRSYLEGLQRRGVPGVAERLDDLAAAAELHLTRAYRKHAPGVLEDFRAAEGLPIPDSTPKSVMDLERDFVTDQPSLEYGQVWDTKGSPISNLVEGNSTYIDWRGDPSLVKWQDGIMTHYHPNEATGGFDISLSEADVRLGIENKLNAIRAVDSNGDVMEANFAKLLPGYRFGNSKKFAQAFKRYLASGSAYPDALTQAAKEVGVDIRIYKTNPEALANEFYQKSQSVVKGSTTFMEDGSAIMRAFEKADFSTAVHEFWHVWAMNDLDGRDLAIAERYLGKARAAWGVDEHERLARAGEAYIREGISPIPELNDLFHRFREWMVAIYRSIKGSDIDVGLTDDMRGVFGRALGAVDEEMESAVRAAGFGSVDEARTAVRQATSIGPSDPRFQRPPAWLEKANRLPMGIRSELRAADAPVRDFPMQRTLAQGAPAVSKADEETVWQGFRTLFEESSRSAFKTHYFNPRRGWLERSINHPYLGIYPVSYMWGKVLPEFTRFLLARPFGLNAPFVGWSAASKVQQALIARIAEDPEGVGKFLEDHKDAIYLFNLILPGTPSNMGAGAPAWARHIARDNIKGQDFTRNLAEAPGDAIGNIGIGRDASLGVRVGADLVSQLDLAAKAFDGIFGNGAQDALPAGEPLYP